MAAVNREAVQDLVECGAVLAEDTAKAIVVAIASGKISHVKMEY